MNVKELHEKTNDELINKLKDLKDSLYRLRAQMTISKVDNPKRMGFMKKDIARVLTVLRQRNISQKDLFYRKDKTIGFIELPGSSKKTTNKVMPVETKAGGITDNNKVDGLNVQNKAPASADTHKSMNGPVDEQKNKE